MDLKVAPRVLLLPWPEAKIKLEQAGYQLGEVKVTRPPRHREELFALERGRILRQVTKGITVDLVVGLLE